MNAAPHRTESQELLNFRWMASALALILIAVSLLLAWQSERQAGAEQLRQIQVQARILAGSVAGALAFDDAEAAREYLHALRANEDITAAGIYRTGGDLVDGYVLNGDRLPARVKPRPPSITGSSLIVVEPVTQGALNLGQVYLRANVEPWTARASRFFGIGAVVLLAALLIAALGSSYAAAKEANRRLQMEIDARETAETQLRQAQKMEAIGQLTGGVAHDFNNMLMAAMSGLDLLERTSDPQRRDQFQRGIRDALDRGAKLTQQLLTFARRAPFRSEVVDLPARLGGLTDLLSRTLGRNVSLSFDLGVDLWRVQVDPTQFDVAILNIAINARDAMPRGGAISITARNAPQVLEGRDAVRICIADEGSGMAPEHVEKAFEPFFTTKGVGRGTGLGLSQVYGFAKGAGGSVTIESRVGVGTRVTLLLPACERLAAAPGEATAVGRPVRRNSLRVLLVESDGVLARSLTAMLEALGCDVLQFGLADDALGEIDLLSVDAVLLDMVTQGERSGLDLARELRRRAPRLPIVLISGKGAALATATATGEGFVVLAKPVSLGALAEKLNLRQR